MNRDRVATLLASGLKAAQVATIVGVSPARISQLLKEEDFMLLLDSKTAEQKKTDVEELAITAKYHAAEHLLLDQITQLAPVAELRDVVGALKVVADRQDKAKQRLNPVPVQGAVIHQNIVQLQLPMQALPEIHIGGNNEVVGIGGNNLAPLSSQGVTKLFEQRRQQAGGRLSSTITAPDSTNDNAESIERKEHDSPTVLPDPEAGYSEAVSLTIEEVEDNA